MPGDEIDHIEPRSPADLGLIERVPMAVTQDEAAEAAFRWREVESYLCWLFAQWRKERGWLATTQDFQWKLTDVDSAWATFEKFDSPYCVRLSELYAYADVA